MFWGLLILVLLFQCNGYAKPLDDYDVDDVKATKINENLDVALQDLWPIIVYNGMDHTTLPDIEEGVSYIFSGVFLKNGLLWNIRNISRYGDTFLTLGIKKFLIRGNVLVGKVNFSYDFLAKVLGISMNGAIHGMVTNTLVAGEFEVNLKNTSLALKQLQILEFGDISLQLKSNAVISWISEPFLRMIARLFESRITTTVSDSVRVYVGELLDDINAHDRLQLKNYARIITPVVDA